MDFIGVGGWEILLIIIVALIILGPTKLPEIARNLGKISRVLKKTSYDLTTTITREIEENEKTASKSSPKPDDSQKPDVKKS